MSTAAQIEANRANAQSSTGPRTAAGLIASARNSLSLGIHIVKVFLRPGERPEYEQISAALWKELNPATPLERTFVEEIVIANWRLHRCAMIEATFDTEIDPMESEATAKIQASVDRARAQCHNILRRSLAELRRLQAACPAAAPAHEQAAPEQITKRTQSEPASAGEAAAKTDLTPRNSQCPCGSGTKYKRCCGINAPAVLNFDSPRHLHPVLRHA